MRIDTIFTNARFITMDPSRPRARALGVLGGRIVGFDEDLDGVRARRTIDLGGACVVPGLSDAHTHLSQVGLDLTAIDCGSANMRSLEDIYAEVAARAARQPRGTWIFGRSYDQNKLGGHPTREALDKVAPDHKVWIKHTSLHMAVGNSAVFQAIDMFGPEHDDRIPAGGELRRDHNGRPTGLVEETAMNLVRELLVPYSHESMVDAISQAMRACARDGATAATEAGIAAGWIGHTPSEVSVYQDIRDRGLQPIRMTLMPASDALHDITGHPDDTMQYGIDLGMRSNFGDEWLKLGSIKVFLDGSLIGHTAAMCTEYSNDPGEHGYLLGNEEELHQRIIRAHAGGWQVAVHAIGDRAVRSVIDAFDEAQRRYPRADARHRIEHCAITDPEQLERVVRLGIIPSAQGRFISETGDGLLDSVGPERARWLYRQRSFLDRGVVLPGSSDRPVVHGSPILSMHDLVNRLSSSGRPVNAGEALTAEQALRAWTHGSAHACFEEHRRGTLKEGMLADCTVLTEDLTAIAPERISSVEVLATIVDGEYVYDRAGRHADS